MYNSITLKKCTTIHLKVRQQCKSTIFQLKEKKQTSKRPTYLNQEILYWLKMLTTREPSASHKLFAIVTSKVTDQRSPWQMIMKKSEILKELPTCDTETWSEQMRLKKLAPRALFNTGLPHIFNFQKAPSHEARLDYHRSVVSAEANAGSKKV